MELFILTFSDQIQMEQLKSHLEPIEYVQCHILSPTRMSCWYDDLFTTYHEIDFRMLLETLFLDIGYTKPYLYGSFEHNTLLFQSFATTPLWAQIPILKTGLLHSKLPLLAHFESIYTQTFKLLDEIAILTLKHYFENDLNVIKTAKEMYVHRNSLNYRLAQIHQKIGIDPRTFYGAVFFFHIIANSTSE